MNEPLRIHIFGASASGTTTLGEALAQQLGALHLDTDSFYWLPTEPPYLEKRAVPERIAAIECATRDTTRWVLSGSLSGWGDPLIPSFHLAVFLYVPRDVRMARLVARESERYGAAIARGGPRYAQHQAFVAWADSYDEPETTGRNAREHLAWMTTLPCPVIRVEGLQPLEQSITSVRDVLTT